MNIDKQTNVYLHVFTHMHTHTHVTHTNADILHYCTYSYTLTCYTCIDANINANINRHIHKCVPTLARA